MSVQTRPALVLPPGVLSFEESAERERILASQFFLVRIGGSGEIGRCTKNRACNSKHRYLTLNCVEQPFSGITRGIYLYWRAAGAAGIVNSLSARQRSRYDEMTRLFGPRDLAEAHPYTAQQLRTGELDMDIGALALGALEPITRAQAKRLADRINAKGIDPPFTLPGLEEH